ncbi:MAG: PQQ-binding-like beta-propeller repeat protein [Planctomycetes bacterium]|nr:PQQ-binding-like beta-propeller repeat protein [Planctomycetota bacterium]
MELKGELTLQGLVEIFKTILESGKECTLIVFDAESKKSFFFAKEAIRIFFSGKRRVLPIGELLVKAKLITVEQLAEALRLQKSTHFRLGEVLFQMGLVKEAQVLQAVRYQIEEEVYGLFTWETANFELFEGPPPEELEETPATSLPFDTPAFIQESLSRFEELKSIKQVIPAISTIFITTEDGEELANKPDLQPIFKKVLPLVDGLRTMEDIINECPMTTSFEIYKAVYLLNNKGAIQKVSFEQIKETARELQRQNKNEKALLFYHQATKINPSDVIVLQNYAEILEKLGRKDEAGNEYKRLGDLMEEKNNSKQALIAYQRALNCLPDDEYIHLKLFDHAVLQKQVAEAVMIGKQLLKIYGRSKEADKMTGLATKLYELQPPDFELRAYVSSAYYVMGEFEKSKEELTRAVKGLPSQKLDDLIKAYENVMEIEPHHADARYQIDRLLKIKAHKRRIKRLLITAGILVFLLIGAAAGLFFYDRQIQQNEFAAFKKELETLKQAKRYEEAIAKCKQFNYPYAVLTMRLLKDEIAAIELLIHKNKQVKLNAIVEKLSQLKQEFIQAEGQLAQVAEYDQILKTYRDLHDKANQTFQQTFPENPPPVKEPFEGYNNIRREFEGFVSVIQQKMKEIMDYLNEAQALFYQTEELTKQDKLDEAAKLIYKLVNDYPHSMVSRNARIPIKIETEPSGAEVFLNNNKEGATPLVVKLPLKGAARLKVARRGYQAQEKDIKPYEQSHLMLKLDKKAEWSYATGKPVESTPALLNDALTVGGLDGFVYSFNPSGGQLHWRFRTDNLSEITSSPRFTTRVIVFGCADNAVYAIRPEAGSARKYYSFKAGGPVKASPVLSADGNTVFIGSADGNFYALNPKLELLWKFPAGGKIVNTAALDSDTVYVASEDGFLYYLDPAKGASRWKLGVGLKPTAPVKYNNNIFVCSENNIMAISTSSPKIEWQFKVKGEITDAPAAAKDTLFVPGGDKTLYAVDINKRAVKWQFQAKGALKASPAVADDVVYFGSDDNYVYALNASNGDEIWRYKTGGPVRATPYIHKNMVYVGSDDNNIYAIEK